ncbi:UPF0280 family protein [Oceaniglobus indicus]|uniref:UPF0280 family protein n=1 Tax=Oceaniglobus indicus TaxID=2047749 RepID=UPI000C186F86|nr:UPF0280 family protein [Oceaniglobus indicus]
MSVQAALLPGDRLHLHHGPIDLVIGCDGARRAGFAAARARFDGILERLMDDYALLRQWDGPCPGGPVARAMWAAVQAHPGQATPMAAVAGAVADAVLGAIRAVPGVRRAYVNNGGDIALYLTEGEVFRVAMAAGRIVVRHADPVRGIATSGRGGRSLSMGIADSVTVLARTASAADVAATLIANAVDVPGHPGIARAPADRVKDDSDLGARPVVVGVHGLTPDDISQALARGVARGDAMCRSGLIHAAALCLQGERRVIGASHYIEAKEPAHA